MRDPRLKVPPAIRQAFMKPQTRVLVGDAKFLLMTESVIDAAVEAANTDDGPTRAALLAFLQQLSTNAFMHGELHLFFHGLQAATKLHWATLLGPLATLTRRVGRNPDKGPIESFDLHETDAEMALDAVVLTILVRQVEATPGAGRDAMVRGLVDDGGNLRLGQLMGMLNRAVPEASRSDTDLACCREYRQQMSYHYAALRGARAQLPTFLDVYTKELIPVFNIAGKTTYANVCMASVEKIEMMLSPYAKFLWATNRLPLRIEKGMLLDEACEVYNKDGKLAAGEKGNLVDAGGHAMRVGRSRQACRDGVDGTRDKGGSGDTVSPDVSEMVTALLVAGVGSNRPDDVGDGALGVVVAPTMRPACNTATAGGIVESDGDGQKGQVVRVEFDRAVLDFRWLVQWADGSVTMTKSSGASPDAVASELSASAKAQLQAEAGADDDSALSVLTSACRSTFASVASGSTVAAPAAATFATSALGGTHAVLPKDPEPGDTIAHLFSEANGGWHVGRICQLSPEGDRYMTAYPDEPANRYPHKLLPAHRGVLWEVVEAVECDERPDHAHHDDTEEPAAVSVVELPAGYGRRVDDLTRAARIGSRKATVPTLDADHMLSQAIRDRVENNRAAASAGGGAEAVRRLAPRKMRGVCHHAKDARASGRQRLIAGDAALKRALALEKRQNAMADVIRTLERRQQEEDEVDVGVVPLADADASLLASFSEEAAWYGELESVMTRLAAIEALGDEATEHDRAALKALVDTAAGLNVKLMTAAAAVEGCEDGR